MKDSYEFYVAGVQFHKLHTIIGLVEVGDTLDMVPEPTNKYDSNAVALIHGSVMVGYVPAKISAEVSAFLEIKDAPTCTVVEINKDKKPWEQLKVTIKDEAEE